MLFYSGFGLDRFKQDAVIFRVWFRQDAVLFSVWFKEGLYSILFYSGFDLEKVYTRCCFIQGLV